MNAAYFEFRGREGPDRFVIKLVELQKVEHARRILSGEETERIHVMGTIVTVPAAYNPAWRFHLKPESIDFFADMHLEGCDAAMGLIEKNLDLVGGRFLPRGYWCPWESILTREIDLREQGSG